MRTRKAKFIIGGALILALTAVAFLQAGGKPMVSMTIVGYTTNRLSEELAARFGMPTLVCAVIAVTNTSQYNLKYMASAFAGPNYSDYRVLHRTSLGWKEPDSGYHSGTGFQPYGLLPSQGFTFEAVIPVDNACKVEFSYSDEHTPNPIWDKLPDWLVDRLPSSWNTFWRTATTEVIDLRKRD